MRRLWTNFPWSSVRVKLVLGLFSITVPLIALLIYNNSYSVNVIHNQVAISNKNLISIHMKQIDEQLSEVERHLMGLTLSDSNLLAMGEYVPQDEYMMAKAAVSRRLDSDLIVYPYIDGLFVYSIPRNDIIETFRNGMGYIQLINHRESLKTWMDQLNTDPTQGNMEWEIRQINGENMIVRLFRNGDIYIGAWAKVETMLTPLRGMRLDETGAVLIVNRSGEQLGSTRPIDDTGLDFSQGFEHYYLTGTNHDYLIVGESSHKGPFSLAAVIPDKQILENLPYLANAAKLVVVIAAFMLLLSMWFLRKVLWLPLRKLMAAMKLIGQGQLKVQIEEAQGSDEFRLVNRTFNRMISQIEELKIHVYEEQLDKHRAELKHLQLQINPHFFMNALNIIYNLAQVKQYELIQEMTMCLVHYFRYMAQSNQPLVLLRDELQHIRNYLRIQQLRLPDRFHSEIRVPEYLAETQVPPLLLQTIVENTMKHAVQMDGSISMTIEASLNALEEEPMVHIVIRDSGQGFAAEALEALRSGKPLIDEKGAHVGLWNARERLRLQFGDRAWMECENDDPGGAVVELAIPLRAH